MLIKILVLLFISKVNRASIAGVTYMDDFDFEQRYRNLYECDPFYWHPLHLPEKCAEMFAKLIRAKIGTPYRVVQLREPAIRIYDKRYGTDDDPYGNGYSNDIRYDLGYVHDHSLESHSTYRDIVSDTEYQYDTIPIETEMFEFYHERPRTPLDKLFELMRRDVKDNPSAPKITSIPYFGGVALYRQPVSFKTEAMIKRLSGAYAKAAYQP